MADGVVLYDFKARKGGDGFAQMVAELPGVQFELAELASDIGREAKHELLMHRATGAADILVEHGDIDWYVILSDERGENAALSIEYGRAGFINTDEGHEGEIWGEMDGLYVLSGAANLPRKLGPRLPRRKLSKREFLKKQRGMGGAL